MFRREFFLILLLVLVLMGPAKAHAGLDLALEAGLNSPAATTASVAGGPWLNLVFPNSIFGISGGLLVVQSGVQLPLVIDVWPAEWLGLGAGPYGALPGDYGVAFNGQIKIPVGVVWFVTANFIDELDLGNSAKANNVLILAGTGLGF